MKKQPPRAPVYCRFCHGQHDVAACPNIPPATTDAFEASLKRITDAPDGRATLVAIYTHYHDIDFSERTPRSVLYLHIGIIVGALAKALNLIDNLKDGLRKPHRN